MPTSAQVSPAVCTVPTGLLSPSVLRHCRDACQASVAVINSVSSASRDYMTDV